ncbi:hypothetical protein CGC21_17315 [Leishmania donovani]|uniref:Uncharacterized protein n=1 Tax=Leishmania donovani TaxID=5661 RepID=A0A3S5H7B9_LEIDO|nr:hypothetical protein LdCL_230014500 [Leishmania donovani]TPP50280.1 hypothetical protein CGC21_17315 [Leishmania donovani]
MPSSHQLSQRHEFVTKPLLLSPVSCTSLSDCARGWTDDAGGVTRSSLTQESLHHDSSSRTWSSSLSASVSGMLLQSLSWMHAPPSLSTSPAENRAAAVAIAASASTAAGDGCQILPMDVFDVALAQDIQQRRVQAHRRRHSKRTDVLKVESTRDAAAGAVPLPNASAKATPGASFTVFSRMGDASRLPNCSQQLPKPVSTREEAAASVMHSLASATDIHQMCALPEHQQGQPKSPALALSFFSSSSGDQQLRSAGGSFSSSAASFSKRNEKMQRLRALLSETRTLHEALSQQLCELQQVEEKEQRRRAGRALARRPW